MIRLLTGLPRENGVGEYVAHLARVGPSMEIFYRRPMTPGAYEGSGARRPGLLASTVGLAAARRHASEAVARTHVTWEGWGPVYGASTRLLTVHHVLGPTVPWPASPSHRVAFAWARRGHRRTVALGVPVVVPSASVAEDLVRIYGGDPARISVVPHFIDTDLFQPLPRAACRARLGFPDDGTWLLHVGTDDGRKNLPGLLRIFGRFRRDHPGARLVQVGRSELFRRAQVSEGGTDLVYRPRVAGADRPTWYGAADAVLLPTYLEGFGRAALEALACGRPAVVSDLPVFREELGEQFRGAPRDDLDGWQRAILEALEPLDPASLREHVRRNFPEGRFRASYRRRYAELGWDPGPSPSDGPS